MQKKISTLVGIIIIIAAAVILFGGAFAYQYFALKAYNEIQSQQATESWKTYKNDKYGFEFKYPINTLDILKNPNVSVCGNGVGPFVPCEWLNTNSSVLEMSIRKHSLDNNVIHKYQKAQKKIIGEKQGYEYDYDTRAVIDDHSFSHTHGFMVSLNKDSYLEINEINYCELTDCKVNCCSDLRKVSNEDWTGIIFTFKFTESE